MATTTKKTTSSSKLTSSQASSMTKQLQQAQSMLNSYKASQAPKTTAPTVSPKTTTAPKTTAPKTSSGGSSGGYNPYGLNATTPKPVLTTPTLSSSQTKQTGLTSGGKPYTMPNVASGVTLPKAGLSSGLSANTLQNQAGLTWQDTKTKPATKRVWTGSRWEDQPISNSSGGGIAWQNGAPTGTLQTLAQGQKTNVASATRSGGGSSGSTTQQATPSPYYQQQTGASATGSQPQVGDLTAKLESLQAQLGTLQSAQKKGFTGDSTGAQSFLDKYKKPEKVAPDSAYPNDKQAVNPNERTQGAFLQSLADRTNASAAFTALNADIEKIKENIRKSKENYAGQRTALYAEPGTIQYKQGKDRLLQEQYKAEQSAMAEEANAIADQIAGLNAQQGLQIQAASSGAGFTAPVMQFGQLTSPQTGQVIGADASGNNPLLMNAVSNAFNLMRGGTSYNDAVRTLDQFGQKGEQMLISALQGTGNFNMTGQNAAATQNAAQGALYGGQATQLSTVLNQLNGVKVEAQQFLNSTGLNTEGSPLWNKQINTARSQLTSPAQVAAYNDLINNVRTYSAQILGNSGLNPTDVGAMVDAIDPSGMTAPQLNEFLDYIDRLGQIRLRELQATSFGSTGGNVGQYTGTQANVGSTPYSFHSGTGYNITDNPYVLGGGGVVMNAGAEVLGVAGSVLKFLGL